MSYKLSKDNSPNHEDEILREIERLRARIRALESTISQKQNPHMTIQDLNVAGPIALEPVVGRVQREFEMGDRIVQRTINEVLFCRCGRRLDQNRVLRCRKCSQLVCEDCAILYHGRVYCRWCFKQVHDLTKSDYKILLCIASGVDDPDDIFMITGVQPETVRRRLAKFMDVYVTDKATCFKEYFFSVVRLTDAGADALAVYEKIFGLDYDSVFVKRKIKGFIEASEFEKLTRAIKLRR